MSAKREAHAADLQAADHAQAMADASAARTWPISVHLTPFAPGCRDMAIDNPKRWRTFYGRSVEQATRSVLTRLNLRPGAVRVSIEPSGDVNMLATPPAELDGMRSTASGQLVPFATFWDGVTSAELEATLSSLAAQDWVPPAKLP